MVPEGLRDVDKTLEGRIVVQHEQTLADVPRKTLRKLNLGHEVDDGIVYVNSRMGIVENSLTRVEEKLDGLMNGLEKKQARPRAIAALHPYILHQSVKGSGSWCGI